LQAAAVKEQGGDAEAEEGQADRVLQGDEHARALGQRQDSDRGGVPGEGQAE
jgi:hypothetical protein